MVDFQSRDTSRGIGDDDEDEDAENDADSADAEADTDSTEAEADELQEDADEGDGETGTSLPDDGTTAESPAGQPADGVEESHSGDDGHEHGENDRSHDDHGDHNHTHADQGSHDHSHDDQGHSHGDHDHSHTHAADVDLLGVAVVTVSSTRTREDDPSGDVIEELVEMADHEVVTREILRDDLDGVQTALLNLTGRDDVDVVVTTGGTGVTPDDVTVEAARPLFDRELPGFGELFRILSYEEVGTKAMASRATAGMVEGVPVFCLPGSQAAVELGTEELILEEMEHLVGLARRDSE